MRPSEAELAELLDEALDLPAGESQIARLQDIVRHAEAAGFVEVLIDARLALVDVYIEVDVTEVGEMNQVIAAFARCLSMYKADPGRFDDDRLEDLWRQFTIVGLVMISLPDYPLHQVRGVLDDMERLCRPDRDDLHTVYALRLALAGQLGDQAGLDACRERMGTLRAAEYVCEACQATEPVRELARQGRYAQAIAAAVPVLGGELPCDSGSQPRSVLAALMLPYLYTGRVDEARDAHRRAYRLYRDSDQELTTHLTFCALTGNEARGLEIFSDNLDQLGAPPKSLRETELMAAAALLLRRLMAVGRGAETFIWPADPDDPEDVEEEWTFAGLHQEYRDDALKMAARFDERNGSGYTTERIRGLMDAEPVCDHLPLSPLADRRPADPTPSTVDSGVPGAAAQYADLPGEPDALLDAAEHALAVLDVPRVLAALQRLDPLAGEREPDPLAAARRADLRGTMRLPGVDTEAELRAAAQLFAEFGREARAQVSLGRLGRWLCDHERAEEGIALLSASLAYLGSAGDPQTHAEAQLRLARVLSEAGDQAAALAGLDRAVELAAGLPVSLPVQVLRANIDEERARCLARGGPDRRAEAAEAARRARTGYRTAGLAHHLAETCRLHAGLAREIGDLESATDAYREAAGLAGVDPEAAAVARANLGRLALDAGRAADAIPDLVEAVAAFTGLGSPLSAHARVALGSAYERVDRPLDAAECAEEALPAVTAEEDDGYAAMQARWTLVCAYPRLNQHADALRMVDEMLARVTDPEQTGRLHKEAGDILSGADRDGEAAVRFAAAADAFAAAGEVFGEAECRRFAALALSFADEPDEAVVWLAQAQEVVDRLPTDSRRAAWERAMLGYDAGRILDYAGQHDEAVERARGAVEGFRMIGDEENAEMAEQLLTALVE